MKFLISLTDKKPTIDTLNDKYNLELLRKTQEIIFWTLMLEKIIGENV